MLLAAVSARADIPFAVDWRLDAPLLAVGATETALSLALPKLLDYGDLPMEKGDLDTVNALDRWAAHGYVKAWDRAGDAADAAKVAVMYAEGFLLTQGTCGLIKLAAKRDRPFMYYDEWDTSGATDGDAHYSFPSSHTADAFMSAAFLTYTFAKIWPDSPWRIPVAAGGWTLAAATAAFRIASANHFPTDVLGGAAIGTLFGLAVPFVHTLIGGEGPGSGGVALSLLPAGFAVRAKI